MDTELQLEWQKGKDKELTWLVWNKFNVSEKGSKPFPQHVSFRKYGNLNLRVLTVRDTKIGMLYRWFSAVFQLVEDMFMRTHASSRVKRKSFYRKSELHMFPLISGGHLCFKTVHQYGVSVQCSTKVHETFPPITQKLSATKTWDLEKLLVS